MAVGVALILIALGAFFLYAPQPMAAPVLVKYSANLSESGNETIWVWISLNPEGMANDMEMALPQEYRPEHKCRGGIVTISHAENTLVRMNSSSDASVRIYLRAMDIIPVALSLDIPAGYDTSLWFTARTT